MAIDAGTLLISIQADTARIKADMDAVKSSVGSAMKDVEQYVGYAKTALVGLIGFGSVHAFIGIIESSIEAKSKLYDMSLQTGISVEALSALGKVAKYSNTDLADVAGASNKLSKALFTQNDESKGAAQAIKALGINFNEFKGLAADEQMLKVAKALDEFQDGSGKSAAAMLLFGKTGATLLPFLKELAEKNELVGKQTTVSAQQAKAYEDNLITIRSASEQWRRELTDFLLPALVGVTNELIDGKKAYGSYISAFWDVLKGSQEVGGLAKTRDGLAEVRKELEQLDQSAARGAFKDTPNSPGTAAAAAQVRANLQEKQDLLERRKAFQEMQQAREALANGKGITDRFDRPKDRLDLKPPADEAKAAVADGYDALMKKITEKIQLDQTELELGRKLTESEKLQIDAYAEVEKNFDKLTVAKMLAIDAAVQLALRVGKERDAFEANAKWIKEATDANAGYIESQMQLRDQLQLQLKDAQLQLAQYGLTAEELKALESARLRDAAAALEQKAAFADSAYLADNARLYREQAAALRDTAAAHDTLAAKEAHDRNDPLAGADRALKEYLADVKRAGDATYGAVANSLKGLEDLGVTALSGGRTKDAARQLVSGIISEFERLYIIKPLMASIFGGAAGGGGSSAGWGSLINGVLGLFTGGSSYSANGGVGYANAAGISGGRAGGGPVDAGKSYLVGEKGPEILRMGNQAGSVVSNDKLGSQVTHIDNSGQVFNIAQGVSRGEMTAALQASESRSEQRTRRLLRNGNM